MISIEAEGTRVCDGLRRRELLVFGGLSGLGLSVRPAAAERPARFGRARSVLFISLFGGPSHQDIWDLKPDAPAEIRGEFRPIRTNVPGIEVSEHIPRLARVAHHYALVRSVTHADNGHGSAMYAGFTGFPHPIPNSNPIPNADDRPAYGSLVSLLRPPSHAVPPFMVVGGTQFVCGNQIPGQRAGFLGTGHEPFVLDRDPNRPDFGVPELALSEEFARLRLGRRRTLLQELDRHAGLSDRAAVARGLDAARTRAFDLLTSSRIREALDLQREKPETRDAYGRTRFGQSLLLSRRLIESGVPFVTANWSTGGSWDTHGGNFTALKDSLLPSFDLSFSAALRDFADRGLLDSTLIIATGEFGRTPKVNPGAGRDHWAGVYTVVLAGAGIRGGTVHGASDAHAAYPATDAVGPWDIAATIFHCLGIDPHTEIRDRIDRPLAITQGEPIRSILI